MTNPILLRLPPLPKLPAPLSCPRPPAWLPTSATHGGLGPDTAIQVCPYAAAPVRVSPPVHGDRRFEAAVRLAESTDAPAVRVLWPSCKDCWTRSDPPRRLGWNCTSQPPQMPQQASKKAGRYGHGLRFRRGTAAPEAVAQPQTGQRHARSPSCTSEPGFRAHRPRFHMCGFIRSPTASIPVPDRPPASIPSTARKQRIKS